MNTIAIGLAAALGAAFAGAAHAADMQDGKAEFTQWCAGCHAPMTAKLGGYAPPAGTYTLGLRYKDSKPAALEERTDLTAVYVKARVRGGVGMMPQTRKTEISDAQLDDLAAYLSKAK